MAQVEQEEEATARGAMVVAEAAGGYELTAATQV